MAKEVGEFGHSGFCGCNSSERGVRCVSSDVARSQDAPGVAWHVL